MSHELRPLRSLRTEQALDVTRAAAASRPPHTTSSCRHTSCNRFAASAHNKLLLSHELRPLRGLRAQQSSALTHKLLLSHKLRPLRGLRTHHKLLLSHELRPLRGLRTQQSFALTLSSCCLTKKTEDVVSWSCFWCRFLSPKLLPTSVSGQVLDFRI